VGETNGIHYNFTDPIRMQQEVDSGLFLEHAIVHGNHYGTSFAGIESVIGNGKICILDIDVQGVDNVKRSSRIDQTKVVFVMLVPPSIGELERRLRGRSTDSEEVIVRRLKRAEEEMEYIKKDNYWDAILVNDDFEQCYTTLDELVKAMFHLGHNTLSPKGSKMLGTLSARKLATSCQSDDQGVDQ
jgi:guanylate kinase